MILNDSRSFNFGLICQLNIHNRVGRLCLHIVGQIIEQVMELFHFNQNGDKEHAKKVQQRDEWYHLVTLAYDLVAKIRVAS